MLVLALAKISVISPKPSIASLQFWLSLTSRYTDPHIGLPPLGEYSVK